MTAKFPTRVIVRGHGPSIKGLAVNLCFEMQAKNNFNHVVFLDDNGVADVSREEFLRVFDEERAFFIMDYEDPRGNFTGKIVAEVWGAEEIDRAIEAYKNFHGVFLYPLDYERNLQAAKKSDQNPENYQIEVEVENE